MSTPREEPTTRWLRLDGRKVRVLERGSGPPVILVHGLGLSAGLWEPHLARLADAGYRAVAPDLPGFGRSEGRLSGITVDAAAAWLLGLADALDIERPAWVGHSVGAQQLVRLAASAPERAAALVLAAPTGRTGWHVIHQPLGLLATAFQERPRLVGNVLRRYLLSPVSTITTWLRSMGHDIALDAPRVACPTLLVVGERDVVVPDHFVVLLEELLPDVECWTIEDASHAVALGPVETFTSTVTRFLARRYSLGVSTDRWKSSGMDRKSHGSSGP